MSRKARQRDLGECRQGIPDALSEGVRPGRDGRARMPELLPGRRRATAGPAPLAAQRTSRAPARSAQAPSAFRLRTRQGQNSSGPGLVRAGARQDRRTARPWPARTRACPDAEPPGRGPARSRPCQDSALDDTQRGTRTSTGLDSVHPAGARKTDQQEPRTGPVVPRTARYGVCMVIIVGPLSARSLRYCSGSVLLRFGTALHSSEHPSGVRDEGTLSMSASDAQPFPVISCGIAWRNT